MTKRDAFGLLADRALLSGDEEVTMAFLLSHKHLLRRHPTRVLAERWITHVKEGTHGEKGATELAAFMRLWARHFFGDLRLRDRAAVLGAMPGLGDSTNNELKLLFVQANHRLAQTKAAPPSYTPKGLTLSRIEDFSNLADLANNLFTVKDQLCVAVELTRTEAHLFQAITAREFLDQAWQREDKILLSPNLTKIIERFNQVSYWVATCILTQPSIEKQALIISKFIRLALDFFKLHNYNGVAQISSALHNSAVQRLRQTWSLLPERHLKKLHKLDQIMQPQQNFWNYRECFDKTTGPKIPYLAVSLRDITFINIGNSNYNADGAINVDRLLMLHQQVQNIRRLQETSQQIDFKELGRISDSSLAEYCYDPPFIDNDEVLHELAARFMMKTKDVNSNVDSILNNSNILSLFHISDSSDSSLSLTVSLRGEGKGGREDDSSWSVLTSETETETESILEEDQEDDFDDEQDDAEAAAKLRKKKRSSTPVVLTKRKEEGSGEEEDDEEDEGENKRRKGKGKKKKKALTVIREEGDESASSSQDLLLTHPKLKKKKKKSRPLPGSGTGSPASSGLVSVRTRSGSRATSSSAKEKTGGTAKEEEKELQEVGKTEKVAENAN
jgi:hypothetical protein